MTTHTTTLDDDQIERLRDLLDARGYAEREVPHALHAWVGPEVQVTLYKSRKLVVQGKGTGDFIEFILEPEVLGEARIGYEDVLDPERYAPRIGIDESGKGDYFGPLCVAGVYANAGALRAWEEWGVRDSKKLSDRQAHTLGERILETEGAVVRVVPIGPEAYNRLQRTMRSVNRILAWGHARVIENLLLQKHRMDPAPVRAISDQFDREEGTIRSALMSLGRGIELVQRHKAESDLVVAAASIVARRDFLKRLADLGDTWGVPLPKGASAAVVEAGRELVRRHGEDVLDKVAKRHFRTTAVILGLPVPERKPFRRGKA